MFYTRLNQILYTHDFDGYVEALCERFYADEIGRPRLPPGRYFRMLLIGYFEGFPFVDDVLNSPTISSGSLGGAEVNGDAAAGGSDHLHSAR